MPEGSAEQKKPAMVENRTAQPLGILPKNTQAMVIAGIAAVMVREVTSAICIDSCRHRCRGLGTFRGSGKQRHNRSRVEAHYATSRKNI